MGEGEHDDDLINPFNQLHLRGGASADNGTTSLPLFTSFWSPYIVFSTPLAFLYHLLDELLSTPPVPATPLTSHLPHSSFTIGVYLLTSPFLLLSSFLSLSFSPDPGNLVSVDVFSSWLSSPLALYPFTFSLFFLIIYLSLKGQFFKLKM